MKVGIAVAGAVVVLLGVVAMVAMRSDGGAKTASNVVSNTATTMSPLASYVSPTVPPITAPAVTPAKTATTVASTPTTKAPTKTAPATGTPATTVPQPSVQDVQKLIAGITAQIQAPSATGSTAPLTKEQVEAQVREQLKQLGITY